MDNQEALLARDNIDKPSHKRKAVGMLAVCMVAVVALVTFKNNADPIVGQHVKMDDNETMMTQDTPVDMMIPDAPVDDKMKMTQDTPVAMMTTDAPDGDKTMMTQIVPVADDAWTKVTEMDQMFLDLLDEPEDDMTDLESWYSYSKQGLTATKDLVTLGKAAQDFGEVGSALSDFADCVPELAPLSAVLGIVGLFEPSATSLIMKQLKKIEGMLTAIKHEIKKDFNQLEEDIMKQSCDLEIYKPINDVEEIWRNVLNSESAEMRAHLIKQECSSHSYCETNALTLLKTIAGTEDDSDCNFMKLLVSENYPQGILANSLPYFTKQSTLVLLKAVQWSHLAVAYNVIEEQEVHKYSDAHMKEWSGYYSEQYYHKKTDLMQRTKAAANRMHDILNQLQNNQPNRADFQNIISSINGHDYTGTKWPTGTLAQSKANYVQQFMQRNYNMYWWGVAVVDDWTFTGYGYINQCFWIRNPNPDVPNMFVWYSSIDYSQNYDYYKSYQSKNMQVNSALINGQFHDGSATHAHMLRDAKWLDDNDFNNGDVQCVMVDNYGATAVAIANGSIGTWWYTAGDGTTLITRP